MIFYLKVSLIFAIYVDNIHLPLAPSNSPTTTISSPLELHTFFFGINNLLRLISVENGRSTLCLTMSKTIFVHVHARKWLFLPQQTLLPCRYLLWIEGTLDFKPAWSHTKLVQVSPADGTGYKSLSCGA